MLGSVFRSMGMFRKCLLFLFIRNCGLRGFGFMRLRKIINIKKIVRFTMRNQIYGIFGHAQTKSV